MIFSVIGTPEESENDLNFVTDIKAVEYLKSFNKKKKLDLKGKKLLNSFLFKKFTLDQVQKQSIS